MSEQLSNCWRKKFGRFFKTAFEVSGDTSWGLVWKKYFCSSVLVFIRKNYLNLVFGGKTQASLSEMRSGCPGEHFEKKQFFKNIYICSSWSFLDFRRIFLGNCLSTGVQTALYVSRWKVWLKLFLVKNIFFIDFRNLTKKIGTSGKKTSAGLSKLHFMCSEEWFEVIYFFWNE